MGKKGNSKANDGEKWGHDQHQDRLHKKIDKQKSSQEAQSSSSSKAIKGYHRSMLLSHDNHEKRQEGKLRLHISKTKREIEAIRRRLKSWDEVSERQQRRKSEEEEMKKRKREDEESAPGYKRKRKGRLGPETWKLRGAARPAWEVYDFDTRYIDPHMKAHQDALERAKRSLNTFHVCKGSFGKYDDDEGNKLEDRHGNNSPLMIESCRKFLSLSMQYALLNLEARKFKSARETLLEIIELEGVNTLKPLTNARCRLMRMYLEANRPDSARRLWEKLPTYYSSIWIRYSAALLEFVSWKILEEKGSSEESAKKLLAQAIRSNVYCAYYIAFHETFQQVMEYTDEVEDAEDGTLDQAIEYYNSEEMGNWVGTEGAVEWIRSVILEILDGDDDPESDEIGLKKSDLEWEEKLVKVEKDYEVMASAEDKNEDEVEEDSISEKEDLEGNGEASEVDFLMFTGMFRTGMDMLTDSGAFSSA